MTILPIPIARRAATARPTAVNAFLPSSGVARGPVFVHDCLRPAHVMPQSQNPPTDATSQLSRKCHFLNDGPTATPNLSRYQSRCCTEELRS
jgi:hypothetical protein